MLVPIVWAKLGIVPWQNASAQSVKGAGQVIVGGVLSRVITTSSCESVQTPFNKVHLKVFGPTPKPVTPEVGLVGVVIVPVPLTRVHVPPPVVGVLADRVAVVPQTF